MKSNSWLGLWVEFDIGSGIIGRILYWSPWFKNNSKINKDIELLVSQVERCNEILKRLSLNPVEEDDFIDKDITIRAVSYTHLTLPTNREV